jgi:hypothetical protein
LMGYLQGHALVRFFMAKIILFTKGAVYYLLLTLVH